MDFTITLKNINNEYYDIDIYLDGFIPINIGNKPMYMFRRFCGIGKCNKCVVKTTINKMIKQQYVIKHEEKNMKIQRFYNVEKNPKYRNLNNRITYYNTMRKHICRICKFSPFVIFRISCDAPDKNSTLWCFRTNIYYDSNVLDIIGQFLFFYPLKKNTSKLRSLG